MPFCGWSFLSSWELLARMLDDVAREAHPINMLDDADRVAHPETEEDNCKC